MSDNKILASIDDRLSFLHSLLAGLTEKLKKNAKWELLISRERGSTRFYGRNVDTGKRVYLSNGKQSVIRSLSQRRYDRHLLNEVRKEIKALGECRKLVTRNNCLEKDILSSMPAEIRGFIDTDIYSDDSFARDWAAQKYQAAKRTANHIHETLKHDFVRSKSELIIADRLFTNGIPYRYEQKLILGEGMNVYYPDFLILNKRTKQFFYWEHLGSMDDADYCLTNLGKLEDYANNGIIQGKNLIITYECKDRPLTTSMIDLMIREFLL